MGAPRVEPTYGLQTAPRREVPCRDLVTGVDDDVSLYQLQRCVWDSIRAGQVSGSTKRAFDVDSYDLTEDEKQAVEQADIGRLYQIGLHPVLLNGFCRASGFSRNEYRDILEAFAEPEERKARWQK
ncbi:MAG TPA: hypothetical protein VKB14_02980 [Actinomycetales bacterium]|nr:hypothetical protein [Actinomycetales bacterium]